MKYASFFALLLVILSSSCQSQENKPGKKYHNDRFKWDIMIPAGFEAVSTAIQDSMKRKGEDMLEKTVGTEIEDNSKSIFVFRSDQMNYIEANYQHNDIDEAGYEEQYNAINGALFETYSTQIKDANIDTVSSIEKIDGLDFRLFKVNIHLKQNKTMVHRMYSRRFGTDELTISTITMDRKKEAQLEKALKQSGFGK